MAATESDFSGIYETAQSPPVELKDQWPDLVRAVQALGPYFVHKVSTGTEPADVLHGLIFGADGNTNHNTWRIYVESDIIADGDIHIQENTGTEGTPVWTTRLTIAAGGFVVPAHASNHASGGSDPVDHDTLTNFVANEHIDHSGVSITAGTGLSGGGTIAATRTLNVDANSLSNVALALADFIVIEDATDNTTKKANVSDIEGILTSNVVKYNTKGEFTKTQGSTEVTTGSSSGTLTLDFDASNYHEITLTENITTITINNKTLPTAHTIILKQAAASSYTLPASWDSGNVVWEDATAPTMPTGNDDEIIIVIFVKSDGSMRGTFSSTFTL